MFHVKTMFPEDFDFAVRITDRMNWNLTAADFEFMTELEPEGCFVLLENSERIGLATTINFGAVAWFGNLIVNESHRGKGAGSLLVNHSIEYLRSKHAKTIGLYAYIDRIPFYKRLGFEYDSELMVLKGKGGSFPIKPVVKEAQKQDLEKIIEFDRSCFGASRKKLLDPIVSDPDNLCYVSIKEGQMVGYVVAKVYRQMSEIGPLICRREREEVAIGLLEAVLNKLGGYDISLYVPDKERGILETLGKLGFAESFRVARMFFGSPVVEDCVNVAESLERG
jgi:predicted N-acetyltransferase YhbS